MSSGNGQVGGIFPGLRTLLPEWVISRWKIARKPQNIEQGM
jgi:hypothetical protein